MLISCFSFTEVAKRAAALMPNGGAHADADLGGSTRVMPNYNVMGVAKAALEALGALSRRRFRPARHPRQRDLGRADAHARRRRHRRCARDVQLPAGAFAAAAAPSRSRRSAAPALYLLSDLSGGVTGEIHYVDSGYNIIAMPHPDALKIDNGKDGGG